MQVHILWAIALTDSYKYQWISTQKSAVGLYSFSEYGSTADFFVFMYSFALCVKKDVALLIA